MNKQINLSDAVEMVEWLQYCTVSLKEGGKEIRLSEQQVLDYAIEMAVRNNTSILEEVRRFEDNKGKRSLILELYNRTNVLDKDELNFLYMNIRAFVDVLDSKARYVNIKEVFSPELCGELRRYNYASLRGVALNGKNPLTEERIKNIFNEDEDLISEFNDKMEALGFKWIEGRVAGKRYKKLVYSHNKKHCIDVDVTKFEKLVNDEKAEIIENAKKEQDERLLARDIVEKQTELDAREEGKLEDKKDSGTTSTSDEPIELAKLREAMELYKKNAGVQGHKVSPKKSSSKGNENVDVKVEGKKDNDTVATSDEPTELAELREAMELCKKNKQCRKMAPKKSNSKANENVDVKVEGKKDSEVATDTEKQEEVQKPLEKMSVQELMDLRKKREAESKQKPEPKKKETEQKPAPKKTTKKETATKSKKVKKAEENRDGYGLDINEVLQDLKRDVNTIYNLPEGFVEDNKFEIDVALCKIKFNKILNSVNRKDIEDALDYINNLSKGHSK